MRGAMHKYDPESAWWNFAAVGNYAARFYSFSMASTGLVRTLQKDLDKKIAKDLKATELAVFLLIKSGEVQEKKERDEQKKTEKEKAKESEKDGNKKGSGGKALMIDSSNGTNGNTSLRTSEEIVDLLTTFTCAEGEAVSLAWRNLFPLLMTTYRDGMVIGDTDKAVFTIKKMFYPRWWLESVGYFEKKGNKDGILFAPSPRKGANHPINNNMYTMIILTLSILSSIVGFLVGRCSAVWKNQRRGYIELPAVVVNA
jgi:hypothetical protein